MILSDDEIINICTNSKTAEPGLHGYILPISFARAIEQAVLEALAKEQEPNCWRITHPSFCGIVTDKNEIAEDPFYAGHVYPLYAHPSPAQAAAPDGCNEKPHLTPMRALIRYLSRHCKDDWVIKTAKQMKSYIESSPRITEQDAMRYRRLRIIGAAPCGSKQLENSTVLRFTSLDEFIDKDIYITESRGEIEYRCYCGKNKIDAPRGMCSDPDCIPY